MSFHIPKLFLKPNPMVMIWRHQKMVAIVEHGPVKIYITVD